MGNEASLQHTNIVRGAGGPQAVSVAPKSVTITSVEAKIAAPEDKENAVEAAPVEDLTNYVRPGSAMRQSPRLLIVFLDVASQTGRSTAPHTRIPYVQGNSPCYYSSSSRLRCG